MQLKGISMILIRLLPALLLMSGVAFAGLPDEFADDNGLRAAREEALNAMRKRNADKAGTVYTLAVIEWDGPPKDLPRLIKAVEEDLEGLAKEAWPNLPFHKRFRLVSRAMPRYHDMLKKSRRPEIQWAYAKTQEEGEAYKAALKRLAVKHPDNPTIQAELGNVAPAAAAGKTETEADDTWETDALAVYRLLPPAPEPWLSRLQKASKYRPVRDSLQNTIYEWRQADAGPQPRLYGAALLLDHEAESAALGLVREGLRLATSAEESRQLQAVRALIHAQAGELVAAHYAELAANPQTGNAITPYWLQVFVGETDNTAFAAIHSRAARLKHSENATHRRLGDALLKRIANGTPMALPKTNDVVARLVRSDRKLLDDAMSSLDWTERAELCAAMDRPVEAAYAAANALLDPELPPEQAKVMHKRLRAYRRAGTVHIDNREADEAGARLAVSTRALAHDPLQLDWRREAYRAARTLHRFEVAAAHLRFLWRAHHEMDIDLDNAMHVALRTGQHDLLLSLAQHAVAETQSQERLHYLRLALRLAGGKGAPWRYRLTQHGHFHQRFRQLTAWQRIADIDLTVPAFRSGQWRADDDLALVYEAFLKSQTHRKPLSEYASERRRKIRAAAVAEVAELRADPPQGLEPHVRFLFDEIDATNYRQLLTDDRERFWADAFIVTKRWHRTRKTSLTESEASAFSFAMRNDGLTLEQRLLAQKLLQEAGAFEPVRPLRSDDATFTSLPEAARKAALAEARLLIAPTGKALLRAFGTQWKSESEKDKYKRPHYSYSDFQGLNPDAALRIAHLPGAPVVYIPHLSNHTAQEAIQRFGDVALPYEARAARDDFLQAMDSADSRGKRWGAYGLLEARTDGLAWHFLRPTPWDGLHDVLAPAIAKQLNEHPVDGYPAFEKVAAVDKRELARKVSQEVRNFVRAGARDIVRRYQKTGSTAGADYRKVVETLGSNGLPKPPPIPPEVLRAQAQRQAQAKKSRALDEAIAAKDWQRARNLAFSLGGHYFTRYAAANPYADLFDLQQGLAFARNRGDIQRLRDRIIKLQRAQRQLRASRSGGNPDSVDSYSRFKASAKARRKASMQKQRRRDLKNNIFRDKRYYSY